MKATRTEIEKHRIELSLLVQRAERYKTSRNVAEKLLEKKSSELYHSNELLRKNQQNLENDVAQATHELQASNAQLKRALEEKSTFIGSLAMNLEHQ